MRVEKDQPLVSIIMGVYNGENVLSSCIDSIIKQTYPTWEFIICDDCSTDNTYKILTKYGKEEKRITIIQNEINQGLAASLNHCLEMTRGKYIARMDADDISMPYRLEKQLAFLEAHPEYDVVGCNRVIFDEYGKKEVRKSVEYPTSKLLLRGVPYAHPTIMMKKRVYENLGGYTVSDRTVRGQDMDLWFRFYAEGYKGYNIQESLLLYHENKNDLKKRTWKTTVNNVKTNLYGYKLLKIPFYYYPIAFMPVLSYILPPEMLMIYRKWKYHA